MYKVNEIPSSPSGSNIDSQHALAHESRIFIFSEEDSTENFLISIRLRARLFHLCLIKTTHEKRNSNSMLSRVAIFLLNADV
jgi:hypothetical protein